MNATAHITTSQENEAKLAAWLQSRGGVAVWSCKDLGSPRIGQQTFTPALSEDGKPTGSPHWSCGSGSPDFVIVDPADVSIETRREVCRVKIRRGPPYLGGVHRLDRPKLDKAMESAGTSAAWHPNYDRAYGSAWFEAVITVADSVRPLVMPVTA